MSEAVVVLSDIYRAKLNDDPFSANYYSIFDLMRDGPEVAANAGVDPEPILRDEAKMAKVRAARPR